jgi:NitT/TauT family transport system permease protein
MKLRAIVAPVLGIAVFLTIWEVLIRVGNVPTFYLRPPSQFIAYLFNSDVHYFAATIHTGWLALQGLTLALLIGLVFGIAMSASRWLEDATYPVMILIQVTPWVAYTSAVVGWLHSGNPPVRFMATFVCVPAFTFAAVSGLRSADPAALELMRSVDASRWETTWRLRLPSALPSLFTAARFAVGMSIAAVYFTEGGALSNEGLGVIGRAAFNANNSKGLWAGVVCAAALGSIALFAIGVLERVLLRWHWSQRSHSH